MNYFFKDSRDSILVSWTDLINDLNGSSRFNPYCQTAEYYDVFKSLIISMLLGCEIILLDSDFSNDELIKLTGFSEFEKYDRTIEQDNIPLIKGKWDLIEQLRNTSDRWKLTIFTSGTTGVPKKVSHDYKSITRFVKYYEKNDESIWGFAYNPSHMAGLQVFVQALLNGNQLIRLFGMSPDSIRHEVKVRKITHLSATPTFYRLLLPCEEKYPSVRRITSGGEKFSDGVYKSLKNIFPNAKFTNIYATTESGTLFASDGDVFTVKPKFEKLVKVVNNELIIHQTLLAKNISSPNEKWFHTGDLVEQTSDSPLMFRFVSRKSDMINVGGYKVNPSEVEETLNSLKGVKHSRVFSKSNSVLGNIVCCEIVREDVNIDEKYIRKSLSSKLQEYKVPRVIRFVDELSMTRTGKIERK
jgi:acyl-coenzyme A synthetase/AMP-(fatty) acid ligase